MPRQPGCPELKVPWPRPTSVVQEEENYRAIERWATGLLKCMPSGGGGGGGCEDNFAKFTTNGTVAVDSGDVVPFSIEVFQCGDDRFSIGGNGGIVTSESGWYLFGASIVHNGYAAGENYTLSLLDLQGFNSTFGDREPEIHNQNTAVTVPADPAYPVGSTIGVLSTDSELALSYSGQDVADHELLATIWIKSLCSTCDTSSFFGGGE